MTVYIIDNGRSYADNDTVFVTTKADALFEEVFPLLYPENPDLKILGVTADIQWREHTARLRNTADFLFGIDCDLEGEQRRHLRNDPEVCRLLSAIRKVDGDPRGLIERLGIPAGSD